jgi:hypothetical protein
MTRVIDIFILSEEGNDLVEPFERLFHNGSQCFAYDMCISSEKVSYDAGDKSYIIPSWETIEGFKLAITESVKQGKNLLPARYKKTESTYDHDALY